MLMEIHEQQCSHFWFTEVEKEENWAFGLQCPSSDQDFEQILLQIYLQEFSSGSLLAMRISAESKPAS